MLTFKLVYLQDYMKYGYRSLIGISFLILTAWLSCKRNNEANYKALDELNLQLTGVIESFQEGGNFSGRGIIRLRVISSNIKEYDPRGKLPYFFCIIKGENAEVYDHVSAVRDSVGDTLIYDTKKRLRSEIKNGVKVNEGSILVSTTDGYYQFIERYTMFKSVAGR